MTIAASRSPTPRFAWPMSSSPGGKVVYATTDRSGAFTLRGLRPGSSYAVIAEYQGDDGMMTGRAQAKAPQADVRISLQPRDGAVRSGSRVDSAGTAQGRADLEHRSGWMTRSSDENRPTGKINGEDIEPPADDAASLPPRQERATCRERRTTRLRRRFGRAGTRDRPSGTTPPVPRPGQRNSAATTRRRPLDHPGR